ncbi:hypothetical protein TNCV_730571 [Trichonephila clavipes]|nr:hypothetical protein TNCV_730571 [Trichonephila clavipes]
MTLSFDRVNVHPFSNTVALQGQQDSKSQFDKNNPKHELTIGLPRPLISFRIDFFSPTGLPIRNLAFEDTASPKRESRFHGGPIFRRPRYQIWTIELIF